MRRIIAAAAVVLIWGTQPVTAGDVLTASIGARPDKAAGGAAAVLRVASSGYVTPGRGSKERAAIMDAARGPVSAAIGQTVIFVVSVLRTDGEWAYLQATPKNPDGSDLDWAKTRFAEDFADGIMDDQVMVLLRKQGGRWSTVDHVIGPTDVYWYNWIDGYGLPEALFNPG